MIIRLLMLAAGVVLASNAADAAPCRDYAVTATQSGSDAYDPASVGAIRIQMTLVTVGRTLDRECSAVPITVAPRDDSGMRLVNGNTSLDIDLVRNGSSGTGSLASYQIGSASRMRLVADGRVTIDLLQLEPGQFVPPGDYSLNLNVSVGDRAAVPVQILIHVGPAIRFVGEAASGLKTISLGELAQGADVTSAFFFKTNAPLMVRAKSLHGGALQHELGPSYGEIPYTAYYSGARLDLKGEQPLPVALVHRVLQEGKLRVVVAPQQNRFAGIYRDTLTLSFTAY